ncbi:MAG TPA: DUF5916 domain-containing protein [Gemmatimonadales bacterium]
MLPLRALSALAALLLPASLLAQDPVVEIVRTDQAPRAAVAKVTAAPPVIDGRLDDAVWAEASGLMEFIQREPDQGAHATERTEVRFLVDREAIYIGAWLFDRDPAGIIPGERIRDGVLTNSDYISIIFDTYHDRQNGFLFATTPAGIEYDAQVVKEGEGGGVMQSGQGRMQSGSMGGLNLNWDASWTVRTSRDSLGWYAEFRIPFSTLRYGGGNLQTWGLNVARSIRRRNEDSYWSPIPRQFGITRLSLAGELQDLPVPARRTATLTPYVLAATSRDFSTQSEYDQRADFGADAKLGLTPSLTLDLTYNTDFAQVEVDEQRVNLTRFPLFFPEKRPFFLENAGVFSAGTPQAVELFFSRRIGIDANGQPVPILGGGRVSGNVGGVTVGALQIFTDDVDSVQSGNSYTVGRVAKEFGRRSRIGAIGVGRISTGDGGDHNWTAGVDGRLGFGDAVTVDWWLAATETPELAGGSNLGYSARLGHQTHDWNNSVRYLQVGEDFNPEVGFLSREDYRYVEATVMRFVPIPAWKWLRYALPHVSYRGSFGLDGVYESGYVHIDPELEFANGGRVGPELNIQHETLREPFAISPRDSVTLPAGDYDWPFLGVDLATDPSAKVSLSTRLELGGFYNGSKYGGNATLTLRPSAAFAGSLLVDYNDVSLEQGDFVRSLVGVRVGYFFTPRISLQSLIQYSNQAQLWSANVRFAWLNTAGTGLFVVFNDSEEATGFARWTQPRARALTVKYTYQFGR